MALAHRLDRGALSADRAARASALPRVAGAQVTVRFVAERSERLEVVRGVVSPPACACDEGAMVTVVVPEGIGYCATARTGREALAQAAQRAEAWARASAASGLLRGVTLPAPPARAVRYESPQARALPSRRERIERLVAEAAGARRDARIAHWAARLVATARAQELWHDGELVSEQHLRFVEPNLEVTAVDGGDAQTRTLGGLYNGICRQGGDEVVDDSGLVGAGARIADEALQLLAAPNCPDGARDLLLAPDQMMLQIHESIGHPLELDRILGDERNFAGTSFVTLDMFGRYVYGSPLLDVSFDPGVPGELASYATDDDGMPAHRTMLIERGVLMRPLGSALSAARARALGTALPDVANARASGWHRPPIDRMANLNVEPGDASLDDMIASVERGILMRTNLSWSIDDSRNKFQFGCEWGRLIESGRLTAVVRNPNYRGVSATFWRSLARVGDRSTFEVMGTPFCGKGEPGQVIRVGHAAPACLFRDVEVFGAAR